MTVRVLLMLVLTCGRMLVLSPRSVHAVGVSPIAIAVYGQAGSFTTNTPNNGGVSATSLSGPRGLVFDSSGNLYIADSNNNRVLYYVTGSTTATRVYGQAGSFTTGTPNNGGITTNSLNNPTGLTIDTSGNLYIADNGNNRVLYYASGSTSATRVYGQAGSFISGAANNGGISATSLKQPNTLALDAGGNLYIADNGNNRVLYYASGNTSATRVYGQAGSFTTGTPNNGGISATSLNTPQGLTLDTGGNLYIADNGNNRVLYYVSGNTSATRVYAQAGSFTTGTPNNGGISATSLNQPSAPRLDAIGDLYLADYNNNRLLYYPADNTIATRVYGQAGSFTTNTINSGGISSSSLDQPFVGAPDSNGNIYVADFTNNRVLQFQTSLSVSTQPPTSTPATSTFTVASQLIDLGSSGVFSDFTGSVSAAIKSGTGATGATLGGTTPVSAVGGIATFADLTINLNATGYILTISSPGVGSANTTAFAIAASGPVFISLSSYFNNKGIGSAPGQANFDGSSYSYPASQLPSGLVTFNGISYQFPASSSGNDNVVTLGQTITLTQGHYQQMSLLASAGYGPATGTATINYTDGSTSSTILSVPDWYTGTGVITSSFRYTLTSTDTHVVSIFAYQIPLDQTKVVSSITLPAGVAPTTNKASIHIFALTLNTISSPASSLLFTPLTISSLSFTLTGVAGTIPSQSTFKVKDATQSGVGWHVTITSTQFTTIDGKTLPTTSTTITGASAACTAGQTCVVPTNGTSYPRTVPAAATEPTPITFFNAAAGTGTGDVTVTVTFSLNVPVGTASGIYISTFTVTLIKGQ